MQAIWPEQIVRCQRISDFQAKAQARPTSMDESMQSQTMIAFARTKRTRHGLVLLQYGNQLLYGQYLVSQPWTMQHRFALTAHRGWLLLTRASGPTHCISLQTIAISHATSRSVILTSTSAKISWTEEAFATFGYRVVYGLSPSTSTTVTVSTGRAQPYRPRSE